MQVPTGVHNNPVGDQVVLAAKKHHLTSDEQQLAQLDYQGQQVIIVNNNQPTFTKDDLDTSKGSWQNYAALDRYNRATGANALLNKSMMPTAKREPLHVNPSGWHNKKVNGKYLYNRSHLIGYQLSGQNNNWKNLITGTRSLNDPAMVKYEDQIADFLKGLPSQYVRYQVIPIYRGDEAVARGVHVEAQSVGSNAVQLNVYIFNVQDGVNINYRDGTSQVVNDQQESNNSMTTMSAVNQGANDDQSHTVYVTPSGHKYHYDPNCRAL